MEGRLAKLEAYKQSNEKRWYARVIESAVPHNDNAGGSSSKSAPVSTTTSRSPATGTTDSSNSTSSTLSSSEASVASKSSTAEPSTPITPGPSTTTAPTTPTAQVAPSSSSWWWRAWSSLVGEEEKKKDSRPVINPAVAVDEMVGATVHPPAQQQQASQRVPIAEGAPSSLGNQLICEKISK